MCEGLLIVWRWICSTHTGSGLCGCGGVHLMVLSRLCCILLALFVDFWWSVKISWRMGLLEEQDGAVMGVFWPSLLAQLPVH